jgi:D-glycero-D-manno-heptose 1,7-bisphosphate phosphatase
MTASRGTGPPLRIEAMRTAGIAGPTLFMDRDGVLIENRDRYVCDVSDVAFLPGAIDAVRAVNGLGYTTVVVTNQACVGKRVITEERALEVHQYVLDHFARAGARLDASYICPHTADDRCACRKPRPGLLEEAAASLGVDRGRSLLVGDALSDLEAARAFGIPSLLVLSGRGRAQLGLARAGEVPHASVFMNLGAVVRHLGRAAPFRPAT